MSDHDRRGAGTTVAVLFLLLSAGIYGAAQTVHDEARPVTIQQEQP